MVPYTLSEPFSYLLSDIINDPVRALSRLAGPAFNGDVAKSVPPKNAGVADPNPQYRTQ